MIQAADAGSLQDLQDTRYSIIQSLAEMAKQEAEGATRFARRILTMSTHFATCLLPASHAVTSNDPADKLNLQILRTRRLPAMSSPSSRKRASTTWACNECKKRKGRCSGGTPCQFCARTNRRCLYGEKPLRTQLTRKNLDIMEARCQALESMIRSLQPGVDLTAIEDRTADLVIKDSETNSSEDEEQTENDTTGSSSFGWKEDPITQQHATQEAAGMALLSDGPSRVGFFGESSGASLLADVEAYLSIKTRASDIVERARDMADPSPTSPFIPIPVRSIPAHEKEAAINDFFYYFNPWYPIIDEAEFRAKYPKPGIEPLDPKLNRIPEELMLRYAIMAMGSFVGGRTSTNQDLVYFIEARQHLSFQLLESGNITHVQALIVMGNYVQKRDRPNTGYIFIGLACRITVALGLHRMSTNIAQANVGAASEQIRRRVFYSAWIIECGFALTTGRPPALDIRHINLPFPADTDDTGSSAHLWTPPPRHLESKQATVCSNLIHQSKLAVLQNRIHGELILPDVPISTARDRVSQFEGELDAWRQALPGYFFDEGRPHWFYAPSMCLIWRERNLSMIMVKSLLSCQKDSNITDEGFQSARQEALLKCLELAMETIDSICTFTEKSEGLVRGVVWYAMYYLIHAVLVMDLAWLKIAIPPPMNFELARQRAEATLNNCGRYCPSAMRCAKFLERVQQRMRETMPPQSGMQNATPGTFQGRNDPQSIYSASYGPQQQPEQPQAGLPQHQATASGLDPQHQNQQFDPRALHQSFWYDPSANPYIDDPWVAPVFDDFSFFQT